MAYPLAPSDFVECLAVESSSEWSWTTKSFSSGTSEELGCLRIPNDHSWKWNSLYLVWFVKTVTFVSRLSVVDPVDGSTTKIHWGKIGFIVFPVAKILNLTQKCTWTGKFGLKDPSDQDLKSFFKLKFTDELKQEFFTPLYPNVLRLRRVRLPLLGLILYISNRIGLYPSLTITRILILIILSSPSKSQSLLLFSSNIS